MRISEIFGLGVGQRELDFIDIDPAQDLPVFLDPHFLSLRSERFSIEATSSIRSFFGRLLDSIRADDDVTALELLQYLHEPNETCLGLSRGVPDGRGLGAIDATKLLHSLKNSRAVQTGLVEHIEDVRIFVQGVDKDKISDMVTNIIRGQLIKYTINQCDIWGIPLLDNIDSGPYWDRVLGEWTSSYEKMLVVDNKKLLLVPKGIVSYSKKYSSSRFHRYGILPFLQHEHLRLNTALVNRHISKSGKERVWVNKYDVAKEVTPDKDDISQFTERHREIFHRFKAEESKLGRGSLSDDAFNPPLTLEETVDGLRDALRSVSRGTAEADRFHKLIVAILDFIFYPDLIAPSAEVRINEGRKRIDIVFENAAASGFFNRLHQVAQIPSTYIIIECKNYMKDPANPELDQLEGRFSINRGKFGLLVFRDVSDENLIIQRCKDSWRERQNLILPITDACLERMLLRKVENPSDSPYEDELRTLADKIRLG
ncbi:hypothetical protein M0D68_19970 [Paraburkholderia sp. SEWSISQ10-3 4]|uniref:hypothetical protein n=1 Tax=Paraburkholderia TaxID=1822464 RepID=UPI00225C38CF|nr:MULTISPECIES: hypothetical protein [Paraburkholderia]MCX4140486.1 hypothetical protein [Paraburkholderia aspalathi]MDN7173171.1 hypothetical protein [Paraburkholderia sp. SEWSISQ10-3 4]MDQ6502812.1 hypothetical protein [Paraburkholderia aspalathi]